MLGGVMVIFAELFYSVVRVAPPKQDLSLLVPLL